MRGIDDHPVADVDRDGRPLRAAITWLDQRKSATVPTISPKWRLAFRVARVADTIRYFQRMEMLGSESQSA